MKVTRAVIRDFEAIQRQHGTKEAIESVLWRTAAALYDDLGVTKITTVYRDPNTVLINVRMTV